MTLNQSGQPDMTHTLTALHGLTLDLLGRREVEGMLQEAIDRGATLMDAPFAEILLAEEGYLVTRAHTRNQPMAMVGERVGRDAARLSWQVYDTRLPVHVEDYTTWGGHQELYDTLALHAVLGVPILVGGRCIGVVDWSRSELDRPFTEGEVQVAQLFAGIVALALDRTEEAGPIRGGPAEQEELLVYDVSLDGFQSVPDWSPLMARDADPSIPMTAARRAAETALTVPVVLRDQTLGTIEVYDVAEARTWSENEVTLATAVASQAALALDNARLYEAAQLELGERKRAEEETLRRNAQLGTLYELGQRLALINDPVEIARTVHNMLGRVMDNSNFYIAYYDEAQNTVSFPVYTIDGVFTENATRPFGAGLTEYVLRTKNPLIVLDNIDETLARLGIHRIGRLSHSLVAMPLMSGDRALGVMTMQDYYRSNAYTAPDIALFSAVAGAVSSFLENARLYSALSAELSERQRAQAELQRRLRETLLLNRVSGKAAAEREAMLVLESVCHDLTEFFGATLATVGLFDDAVTRWEVVVDYSTQGLPSGKGQTVPLKGLPVFDEVTTTRAPFYSPDTQTDLRVAPIRGYLQSRGSRSFLLAPLVIRDQVIGAISITKPQPNGFMTDDFPIVQNVANTISQSLANSRLYESLQQELNERKRAEEAVQRRNEELGALNRITSQAGSMLDPRALLQLTTTEVVKLFHARNSGVALLNPERTHLEVVADSSSDESGPHTTGLQIPLEGNQVTLQVIETGRPVIISDAGHAPDMGEAMEIMENLRTQSILIIPLRVRGEVIGTIAVETDDPVRRFTAHEAELGETIATQIAGALENARLFERIQTHATEMESSVKEKEVLLQEIHHRVKNNLQVVISLLNLESARIKDKEMIQILKESQTRIRSMALIHEKLYQSKDFSRVDFDGYVRNLASYLFRTYKASAGAIELEVDVHDVYLGIDRAIPCGLIINELVTNSLKYAFPEGRGGKIVVELHPEGTGHIMLCVRDNGVGFPADLDLENSESLGMSLVVTLTNQLGGKLTMDGSHGASFTIVFPS